MEPMGRPRQRAQLQPNWGVEESRRRLVAAAASIVLAFYSYDGSAIFRFLRTGCAEVGAIHGHPVAKFGTATSAVPPLLSSSLHDRPNFLLSRSLIACSSDRLRLSVPASTVTPPDPIVSVLRGGAALSDSDLSSFVLLSLLFSPLLALLFPLTPDSRLSPSCRRLSPLHISGSGSYRHARVPHAPTDVVASFSSAALNLVLAGG